MCGFVAVKGVRKAAELAVIGAHALQNRARTYAGAVSSDGQYFYRHAGKGLAKDVLAGEALSQLHGKDALAHLRYPTLGDKKDRDNTQPIQGIYAGKPIAIGHNGNLTNMAELHALLPSGFKMQTSPLDTEYILRLLEQWQTGDIEADLKRVLSHLRGSYCLAILTPEHLIAVRDPQGSHPLCVGKLEEGHCVASENCAFPLMEARLVQDVAAGTMVFVGNDTLREVRFAEAKEKHCVFELLYNSSPASRIFDVSVTRFRKNVGRELHRLFGLDSPLDVLITPVPDSGYPYAMGYAEGKDAGELFPVEWRNHYVGRTFNAASQALRDEEVSRKFIFESDEIVGKRIVVLDDSIVRGTTLPKIVDKLWWLGAKEVHVRIAAPPIKYLCRYGIYMDEDQTELVATKLTEDELCRHFKATSLKYLPLATLKSLLLDPHKYCYACMDGQYWD
jgi:amidophosphoribosyltransferase